MPVIPCKICGKSFYTKPNWLERGKGKYCSIDCAGKARRRGKMFSCFSCKRQVYKSLREIKRSIGGKFFCSKACSLSYLNQNQFGENHGNWKHGTFAYKTVIRKHKLLPFCRLCNKKDGRILVVHHIDKDRKNNSIENLTWLCFNCHFLVHHYQTSGFLLKSKLKR